MAAPSGPASVNWTDSLINKLNGDDWAFLQGKPDEFQVFRHFQQHSLGTIEKLKRYFADQDSVPGKSAVCAEQFRVEGNKLFQKKLYNEAISKYTQAIVYAPGNSEQLGFAYGNRSAALFREHRYQECVADIEAALRSDYPSSSGYKLMLRKAHCLHHLGNKEGLNKCVEELNRCIVESTLDSTKRDEVRSEIAGLQSKATVSGCNPAIVTESDKPVVSYGNNDMLVQASSCVSLQYTEEKGRYLTATRDIKAGDTLIIERPFTGVLLPPHYTTHCHRCFGKLKLIYPCRRCTVVNYCSYHCSVESWESYHSIECPYLKLLTSVGIAHISFRIILVAGLKTLLGHRQRVGKHTLGQSMAGLDERGRYCRNYLTVYDLLTHLDDTLPEDLLQYIQTTQILLKVLQHSGWFKQELESTSKEVLDESNETAKCSVSKNCDISAEYCTASTSTCDNQARNNSLASVVKVHDVGADTKDRDCVEDNVGGICNTNRCLNKLEDKRSNEPKNVATDNMYDAEKLLIAVSISDTGEKNMAEETVTVRDRENQDDTEGDELTTGQLTDIETYVGGLLLRHTLQLICNAHAITELQYTETNQSDSIEEKSQVRIATAIYPTASLMNHSCDPTIISSFNKDTLVVRAVKDVVAEDEIFNCYGPHHCRMDYTERQACLKQQYFFTCVCPPCSKGSKIEDQIWKCYRCPDCEGPVYLSTDDKTCDIYTCICENCDRPVHIDSFTLEQPHSHFSKALTYFEGNNLSAAINSLKLCIELGDRFLYKHNKLLAEARDLLARIYASKGNFGEAAVHLRDSIGILKAVYGEDSIEVANELQKLSEILISAQDWKAALLANQEASKLFELHYGKSHDSVKELADARRELKAVIKGLGL